jgi:CHASE2 domain-containing sensor protein
MLRGTLIAVIVLLIDSRGYLTRLENDFYDLRVEYCQRYRPQPADELVHLDIDDNALLWMGKWPWPTDMEAQLLDEIGIAHPKVVAMDILFGEATRPRIGQQGESAGEVSPDEQLAAAVKRLGCVLLPVCAGFEADRPAGPYDKQLLDLLARNPQITEEQCLTQLGVDVASSPSLRSNFENAFLAVRAEAIRRRVEAELELDPTMDETAMERRLAPNTGSLVTESVVQRLVREEFDLALRVKAIRRFSLPNTVQPLPVLRAVEEIVPPLPLCRAAASDGFVNYLPDGVGGAVRSVPLLIEDHGRLVPQMALATACAQLDVDIKSLRITPEAVVIPRPGQADIRIPLCRRQTRSLGTAGMLMELPIFGPKDDWPSMYNMTPARLAAKHVSIYKVYQALDSNQRIVTNERSTDDLILSVLLTLDPKMEAEYATTPHHGAEQRAYAQSTLALLNDVVSSLGGSPDADDLKDLGNFRARRSQLQELLKQTDALRTQLATLRAELHDDLGGKAVFVGSIATANGDSYPTSLHYACPGVVIHGALFNAIMTGKMWKRSSPWVGACLTLAMGLLVTLLVTLLPPFRAFLATLLVVGGYLLINGYLLFDRGNLIVDATGPTVAGLLVWAGRRGQSSEIRSNASVPDPPPAPVG